MRTLKKSLALVLVLAMMFSLAVTASADFTDAEKIEYADEVELLVALGVIEGYDDNTFQPTKTLNRAEAAIIAARLNAFFDETATENSYDDMAGYNWANWAVAYCENAGIVNGTGAGKFEPATTLTGYMWVKMVLVSMGYDAEEYGMTGTAWQIGVAALDKVVGISGGEFDLSKEISREVACLFAYNALLATRDGAEFAVLHNTTEKGLHAHYFDNELDALAFAETVGLDVISGELVTTLGFEKFGLEGIDQDYDKWGNPYYGWVAAGEFITKHDYAPIATYNTAIYEGKLYADLVAGGVKVWNDKNTTEDLIVLGDVYVDGAEMTMTQDDVELYKKENGLVDYSGNGTSLKVYDTMKGVIVVAINEYIGTIAETFKANATTGADAYAILDPMCTGCRGTYKLPGEYTKGDVVLYNLCWSRTKADTVEVIFRGAPNTVTGKLTKTTSNSVGEHDDVYTIGGADYLLSKHNSVIADDSLAATWYVDSCGNLMALKERLQAEYTVAYLVDYDAENYWAAEHSAVVQEAKEVFTFYDPATGETYQLNGDVQVKTAKDHAWLPDGTVYTEFATGLVIPLDTADEGIDNADLFDLKNVPFTTEKAGLSLGLVVYMTNEDNEIIYISDEESFGDEIAIVTVSGATDNAGDAETVEMEYFVHNETGAVEDEVTENRSQYTKYSVKTVTVPHSVTTNVVTVINGVFDVYNCTLGAYDEVTVTTTKWTWDNSDWENRHWVAGEPVVEEYTVEYTDTLVNSYNTSNEDTVFYYDALTKITNCAATSVVGFANAKTLAAPGEYAIDLATKEIIAVAQYKDAPAPSTDPTIEYVYVGSDYDFTVVTELNYNKYGYPWYGEQYAVATGLYIDGVSVGEVVLSVDEAFKLEMLSGKLWKVSIDAVTGAWSFDELVGGLHGKVTAIYYDKVLKIGVGGQYNLADDCVIVRVNDLYGTVSVGTVNVGDTVVFADYNKDGEITLLYVTNIDD